MGLKRLQRLSDFENVGVGYMAASKRSLKLEVEGKICYASIKDVERALRNPGKTFRLWKRKATMRPHSCEAHRS